MSPSPSMMDGPFAAGNPCLRKTKRTKCKLRMLPPRSLTGGFADFDLYNVHFVLVNKHKLGTPGLRIG
jgi:hypothetical protein